MFSGNNNNNKNTNSKSSWTDASHSNNNHVTAGDSRTSDGVRPTFIDGDVRDFEEKDHYGNDSYLSNYRTTNSTLGDRNDAGVRAVANERGNNTFLDMSGDGNGKNSYSGARDHDRSLGFSSSLNGSNQQHHLATNSTTAAHQRDEARVRDFANNRGNNTFLDMSGGGTAGGNANKDRGSSGSNGVDSSTVHERIHGAGSSFGSDNQSFNNKTSNTSNVPASFLDGKENYGNRVSESGSAAVANDKSKQSVNKPVDASLRGATTTTHSNIHSNYSH